MEQPALFGQALPTVPGYVSGVVAIDLDDRGRKVFTFQCADCHATDTPVSPGLTQMLFHPLREDGRRRCKACRTAAFPDCTCHNCTLDRTGRYHA